MRLPCGGCVSLTVRPLRNNCRGHDGEGGMAGSMTAWGGSKVRALISWWPGAVREAQCCNTSVRTLMPDGPRFQLRRGVHHTEMEPCLENDCRTHPSCLLATWMLKHPWRTRPGKFFLSHLTCGEARGTDGMNKIRSPRLDRGRGAPSRGVTEDMFMVSDSPQWEKTFKLLIGIRSHKSLASWVDEAVFLGNQKAWKSIPVYRGTLCTSAL